MVELDENGWAPIHHAAARNYTKSVERFIQISGIDQLEIKTEDGVGNTPLLLAVSFASKEAVDLLARLGADIDAVNNQRHGVVELCALHGHIHLLDYFINLKSSEINVYKNLIILLDSTNDKEAGCAGSVIAAKTVDAADSQAPRLIDEGLVAVLLHVLEKKIGDNVKEQALNILTSILKYDKVKDQLLEYNGFQGLMPLIKVGQTEILLKVLNIVCEVASENIFVDALYAANTLPALCKVIAWAESTNMLGKENRENILITALHSLGLMAEKSAHVKDDLEAQDVFSALVNLFEESESKKLVVVLSTAVASIVAKHPKNQDTFVRQNGAVRLLQLVRSKLKYMQSNAIHVLNRLVEGNVNTQKNIIELNGIAPLVQMLKQSQAQHMQEDVAEALWAVAGAKKEILQSAASKIGVNLLVDFLGSQSHKLQLIGIAGLSLLVQSPYDMRSAVAALNGAQYLTRLLQSEREQVVTKAIQALRHICLGVGYLPHHKNQTALANFKGLRFLIALMTRARSELIKAEAAYAIAAAVLGNTTNMEFVYESASFSYVHILRLLYSSMEDVRLLAGAALATFAFNSASQQRHIVDAGGVRWHNFQTFLQSEEEIQRVNAAFQATVLARIIPDNEPASTSATGIKILMDTLQHSTSHTALALAADCVARLAHTRAGVPDALVSIDVVTVLCQLLSSSSLQVQGCAAIALRYLTFNPQAERQLLKRCSVTSDNPSTLYIPRFKLECAGGASFITTVPTLWRSLPDTLCAEPSYWRFRKLLKT